ncbi:uncharacterized protein LOC135096909 [Scylla paramamosain]|uniref:uncharacterized protein LOC135096909 n=1 Tax=Scylla paramamosain TaxID=85552 RepID=UPI003083242F
MSVPASSVLLLSPREKAVALTNAQRQRLSEVITSKKILLDHSTDFNGIRKKQKAWEEVAAEFNLSYPAERPRTVTQLKRAWEYIRVKKNHKKFLHESFKTGGGPSPKPVTDDFLAVATDALAVELQFADNQLDSLVPIVIREEEVEIIDDDMLPACTIAAGPSTTPAAGPATAPAAGPATAPAAGPVTAPPPGPATAPAAGPATTPPPGPATAPPPGPASAPPTVTATAPAMAPATPPAGAATAPGGTSQTGPSTRRGRKRPLRSEREECFRAIREGAETLNDDLKVSLQNFSALCEKLGNQAEVAANAFAQAMQTSTNAFVQTMHNVDSTMEQVRKYYSPASGRPSSL